jgi:hypothetical protein
MAGMVLRTVWSIPAWQVHNCLLMPCAAGRPLSAGEEQRAALKLRLAVVDLLRKNRE